MIKYPMNNAFFRSLSLFFSLLFAFGFLLSMNNIIMFSLYGNKITIETIVLSFSPVLSLWSFKFFLCYIKQFENHFEIHYFFRTVRIEILDIKEIQHIGKIRSGHIFIIFMKNGSIENFSITSERSRSVLMELFKSRNVKII